MTDYKLVPTGPTPEWVANLKKVRIDRMESVIEDVLAAAPQPAPDVSALVEALGCLYDAIDSCVELTPDIMRKAEAALAAHRKQGSGV